MQATAKTKTGICTETHTDALRVRVFSLQPALPERATVQTLNTDHRQPGQCFILAREHYRLMAPPRRFEAGARIWRTWACFRPSMDERKRSWWTEPQQSLALVRCWLCKVDARYRLKVNSSVNRQDSCFVLCWCWMFGRTWVPLFQKADGYWWYKKNKKRALNEYALGFIVFRGPLCHLETGRCVVSCVYMRGSCSRDQLSVCRVLWLRRCAYLSKCGWACVTKRQGVGGVWRWHTSPQGILFLVFHAHGQRCSLWDLCRGRRRRKKVGGKKNERGQRARGQGWAGVQRYSIIKPALEGNVVLRGASVCVRTCVCVCVGARFESGGEFAGAWLDSLKSTRSEMDWTASPVNPDC